MIRELKNGCPRAKIDLDEMAKDCGPEFTKVMKKIAKELADE